jgi:putative membrane protein
VERSKRATQLSLAVLIILHVVGLFGFLWEESRPLFQQLVPFNLLIAVGLLAYFHREWSRSFLLVCLFIFLAGFGVEVWGINTGVIFGPYVYDSALGPKLWGTPPMIGVNWLMLVYCAGVVGQRLPLKPWLQALIGALALVFLDWIMEPVAIRYDFWHWLEADIPLQNFIAWGLIAFFFLLVFHYSPGNKQNRLAGALLAIQFVFFSLLRWLG